MPFQWHFHFHSIRFMCHRFMCASVFLGYQFRLSHIFYFVDDYCIFVVCVWCWFAFPTNLIHPEKYVKNRCQYRHSQSMYTVHHHVCQSVCDNLDYSLHYTTLAYIRSTLVIYSINWNMGLSLPVSSFFHCNQHIF